MTSKTPSKPPRFLNTNFTPSKTKYTLCIYTIELSAAVSSSGNQKALVELRSDAEDTPTTVRCSTSCGVNLMQGGAIEFTGSQQGILLYIVPPNHSVCLASTLTQSATASIIHQVEIMISPEIDPIDFTAAFPSE